MKCSALLFGGRIALLAFLASVFLVVGCLSGAQVSDVKAAEERLRALQEDIALLEEFNRLDLTREQLQALLTQVEAMHETMRQRDLLRLDILQALEALLDERRTALLNDQPPPPAVTRQIQMQTEKLEAFDRATQEELLKFAQPIKAILKPDQLDILTWVSEARLQAAEYLDWVRSMSEEDFKAEAEVNAEGLAENRQITKEEILDIYRTARAMDAQEYEQAKGKLADKLVPAFRDDTGSIDLVLVQRLQPERVPTVLREKLARMQ